MSDGADYDFDQGFDEWNAHLIQYWLAEVSPVNDEHGDPTEGPHNVRLMAKSRSAIPRLLADLDRAEAKLQRVREAAQRYFDGYVQDEADDRENCITDQQHEDAKALRAVLKETETR